jgi:alpha,alpha-trehalose-phosphate synthase [UDP-forming]
MQESEKFRQSLPDRRFVVISNREPYEHVYDDQGGTVDVRRPAGGLTSALDPILQATEGDWIAWGSGDADFDVADADGRLRVPPENPRYNLHRVRLDQRDIEEYYLGYANQVLWPLCHYRPALTRIRARHWARYESVNRRFAEAAVAAVGGAPAAIWSQDYHLALTPRFLRERVGSNTTLAQFWHIPFPPPEIFRIATRAPLILQGLLANDLLGFHLPDYVANFLRCVQRELHIEVDFQHRCVRLDTHICWVRALPISIDVGEYRSAATVGDADARMARIRKRYAPNGEVLGVGVDRMDYSKGLEEKLKALDFLWDRYPEWRQKFTFVQVAVPSRTDIEAYDRLSDKVERMAWAINERYGVENWTPIHLIRESMPAERLALLYRTADVCIISSLQDGMNLVAKEFVASQVDRRGVLMLSKFAGAIEEMDGCIPINPYDPEDLANLVNSTLQMPAAERATRLEQLQKSMRTIYDWLDETFDLWGAAARGGDVPLSVADRWR